MLIAIMRPLRIMKAGHVKVDNKKKTPPQHYYKE
jgi:hypothetical protein